jgi:transcriptional regulator with XRE-family HTH domain
MKHIGVSLRMVRNAMGLDQGVLAKLSGISSSHLCSIELGNRDPSWTVIQKLCTALGVDVSFVVMMLEADKPSVKPYAGIAYGHILELSQANGETK